MQSKRSRGVVKAAFGRAGVLALGLVGLAAGPAGAVEVYVNGIKLTGALKNQTFKGAEVQFDANGDVRISAPGYKIEVEQPGAQQAPAPKPGKQVWLVVNVPATGHYKTAVQVNGKAVAEIPATSSQYVKEITDGTQPGRNGVLFTFYPQPDAPAGAPVDAVDILVGEGEKAADGTLTISRILGTVKRKSGSPSAEAVPVQFELSASTTP
jgi:hypothetical protein